MSKATDLLNMLEDSGIKAGDRVKINLKHPKLLPQQIKILKQMTKDGGDGKVLVHSIDGSYAEVSGWEMDRLKGTVRVPLDSLSK